MALNDAFALAGSVGWLIDRTAGEHGIILGSAWLFSPDVAITCAHLMVPYADMPEAVSVYLPAFQQTFGVTGARFHPDFDRWMVRRAYQESTIYPPPRLSLQPNNVVGIYLSPRLQPVHKEAVEKKLQSFSGMQETSVFSGTSSGTELMTIIQTIVNARQVGTIIICDSRRRVLARVFCESGSIRFAQFGDLRNETAIYHLIASPPDGKFFFKVESQPAWTEDFSPIKKATSGLLLDVFRRLDDSTRILEEFGGELTTFIRTSEAPIKLDLLPEHVRKDASLLWPRLKYETPVGRFIHNSKVNSADVLRALEALAASEQVISASAIPISIDGAPAGLPVEPYSEVSFKDEIGNIYIDPASQMAVITTGAILGSRKEDPAPQMLTIGIPPNVLGAPIFKKGMVIGIHCGNIAGIEDDNQFQEVNQMLWSESILTCLNLQTNASASTASPQRSVDLRSLKQAEAGASPAIDGKSADLETTRSGKRPRTNLLMSITSALPFSRRKTAGLFDLELQRQEFGSSRWCKIGLTARIKSGDILSLAVKIGQADMALCVLYSHSDKSPVRILFPEAQGQQLPCDIVARGSSLVLPDKTPSASEVRASGKIKVPGIRIHDISGQESITFICNSQPFTLPANQTAIDKIAANASKLLTSQPDLKDIEVQPQSLFDFANGIQENFLITRFSLNCR